MNRVRLILDRVAHTMTGRHRWRDDGPTAIRCYCGARVTRADWP